MNSDRQTVTVLHVASFSGNSGDLANHLGFRKWFENILGRPIQWVELEITIENFGSLMIHLLTYRITLT